MAKKRKSSGGGCSFLGCFMVLALIALMGIGGAGYYLVNRNLFHDDLNLDPISIVQRVNPDATLIPATNAPITPDSMPNSPTFNAILADLNQVRANAGLNPLQLNARLNNAAAVQVAFNAENLRLSHEDANGNLADVRVQAQGYEWQTVGENLLSNWSLDGHEVFELWQDSPNHNENMMNPSFTEIGLAYTVTPLGQVYHAMVLARPQ